MSLLQLDGMNDTPQEKPGRCVEVEGREMEKGEEAMKDWVSVRRKGQVETEKEEMQTKQEVKDFMLEYPHIALVRSQEEMEGMMRLDEEGMERVRQMEEYWKAEMVKEMEKTSGGRG